MGAWIFYDVKALKKSEAKYNIMPGNGAKKTLLKSNSCYSMLAIKIKGREIQNGIATII